MSYHSTKSAILKYFSIAPNYVNSYVIAYVITIQVHDRKLGSGTFGLVLLANIKGPLPDIRSGFDSETETATAERTSTIVAVKTVKPNVEVAFFLTLLSELKVMSYVGQHPNIASFIGASTTRIKNRDVCIVLEFCAKGDLLSFLKKHRRNFQDLISRNSNNAESAPKVSILPNTKPNEIEMTSFTTAQPTCCPSTGTGTGTSSYDQDQAHLNNFSTLKLLDWSHHISEAMDFISSRNVIHGDLAARNVLLTAGNIAKVSDFGLSRQLHNYSTYKKKQKKTPLPWKWMAIESLQEMEFSVNSDIWAFGVTLFEIFSLGGTPYPGQIWNKDFIDDLLGGLRLKSPQFGNAKVFNLMMDCMKEKPTERKPFPQISHQLMEIKRQLCSQLSSGATSDYVIT